MKAIICVRMVSTAATWHALPTDHRKADVGPGAGRLAARRVARPIDDVLHVDLPQRHGQHAQRDAGCRRGAQQQAPTAEAVNEAQREACSEKVAHGDAERRHVRVRREAGHEQKARGEVEAVRACEQGGSLRMEVPAAAHIELAPQSCCAACRPHASASARRPWLLWKSSRSAPRLSTAARSSCPRSKRRR